MAEHPTLDEMKAKGLPRLTTDDLFTGNPTDEEKAALSEYLQTFALPVKRDGVGGIMQGNTGCICCGKALGGFLGTFQWGIINGEGTCSSCGWPHRAHHRPKQGPVEFFELILPYHPDDVKQR